MRIKTARASSGSTVRETDFVCRIGGEEFAVIAPTLDLAKARQLAERLSARVADAEYEAAGRGSVSAGVAIGPDHDGPQRLAEQRGLRRHRVPRRSRAP